MASGHGGQGGRPLPGSPSLQAYDGDDRNSSLDRVDPTSLTPEEREAILRRAGLAAAGRSEEAIGGADADPYISLLSNASTISEANTVHSFGFAEDKPGLETQALIRSGLPGRPKIVRQVSETAIGIIVAQNTVAQSIVLLATTIMGAGVLSLPFSFASIGVGFGLAMLAACATAAIYSFDLLMTTQRLTGAASYSEIADHYYGRWGVYAVQFSMMLLLFGASVIYIVLIGDNLTAPIGYYSDHSASIWFTRPVISGLAVVVIFPLTLFKELRRLRYASYVCLVCLGYLLLAVAFRFAQFKALGFLAGGNDLSFSRGAHHERAMSLSADQSSSADDFGHVPWFVASVSVFIVIPIQSSAFTGQFNSVGVQRELKNPTPGRSRAVAIGSILTCFLFYSAFALLGVFTFGEATPGDLLTGYYADDILINLGRLALTSVLVLTFPLFVLPLRETLFEILKAATGRRKAPGWIAFVTVTAAINVSSTLLAIVIPNLSGLLDIVGATTGMAIAFVLPGLFGVRAFRDHPGQGSVILAGAVAAFGVVCGVVAVVTSILHWNDTQ